MTTLCRLLLLFSAALLLTACRLDANVDVMMNPDGSGEVSLAVSVDADVVQQVPGLEGSLSLTDAIANGWVAEGPAATDDGGLGLTLRHPFTSVAEASNVLTSLGPPFTGISLAQILTPPTGEPDEIATTLMGSLSLPGGTFDAFADSELLAATGGTPFGAQLAAAGATPASSMSIRLTMRLPGQIQGTTGQRADGAVSWDAPLDGSSTDLGTQAVLGGSGGSKGGWGPVATIALVLLILWVLAAFVVAALVVRKRSRRRYR